MLPSARVSLSKGSLSLQGAAYATIGCFLGGVVAIQLISHFLHRYIPSHVVDCDHQHDHSLDENQNDNESVGSPGSAYGSANGGRILEEGRSVNGDVQKLNHPKSENAPLLGHDDHESAATRRAHLRPTLQSRLTSRVVTMISRRKQSCDNGGPCYGYSDLCGQECFEGSSRNAAAHTSRDRGSGSLRQAVIPRRASVPFSALSQKPLADGEEEFMVSSPRAFLQSEDFLQPNSHTQKVSSGKSSLRSNAYGCQGGIEGSQSYKALSEEDDSWPRPPSHHHHHVPTNTFLSIGLQTSIAIAVHKLPEGFITYATNHANPQLGFTVFMALFIHNITEGYAMALPLFLALGSRWRSMFWSFLLGGVSQPLGAGIAALWFKIAGKTDMAPSETVYGCMFAITAGIMASVALQLFSESLGLTHNRHLCIFFAFVGMGVLGLSFALTAS